MTTIDRLSGVQVRRMDTTERGPWLDLEMYNVRNDVFALIADAVYTGASPGRIEIDGEVWIWRKVQDRD